MAALPAPSRWRRRDRRRDQEATAPSAPSAPPGDVPGSREAPEMIQTEHVHVRQQNAHAVDVPAVAGAAQSRPVIDGIAPELPLSAEVVGRYPGDEAGPVLLVQEEQVGI